MFRRGAPDFISRLPSDFRKAVSRYRSAPPGHRAARHDRRPGGRPESALTPGHIGFFRRFFGAFPRSIQVETRGERVGGDRGKAERRKGGKAERRKGGKAERLLRPPFSPRAPACSGGGTRRIPFHGCLPDFRKAVSRRRRAPPGHRAARSGRRGPVSRTVGPVPRDFRASFRRARAKPRSFFLPRSSRRHDIGPAAESAALGRRRPFFHLTGLSGRRAR